jgi:hypothetical protein
MINEQFQEIPQVDVPFEVSPVEMPEVEIAAPHPSPNSPGAGAPMKASHPIGFTAK